MNIISAFDSSARKYPHKDFLRYQGQSHSYADVQSRSRQAAAVLAGQGVRAGDAVAIMCLNTPGFMLAMLGAWRLNAVVVPVNHKLQAPEVAYILQNARVRLCIVDTSLASVMTEAIEQAGVALAALSTASAPAQSGAAEAASSSGTPGSSDPADLFGAPGSFDTLLAAAQGIDGVLPADEDPAQILYTSGTTGKPKGCVHSHRGVCLTAMIATIALSIERNDRTLVAMPLWHSSPLNNWMMATLLVGGTVVLLREYHPQQFLQAVQDERITLYFGAPVSYLAPLHFKIDPGNYELGSVRAWIYGGGPISAEIAAKLATVYQSERFFQVYGMTETGPVGTTLYPEEQLAKAGSIGRVALTGVDMRVVRDDGTDAGSGEVGEIWLKSDSAMQGYFGDPEATAQAFHDGWYRTGDLARLDEDGYLFIVDRNKDMIITGGENVYSKEVEDALSAHPAVQDVAVIGRPHPEWGETVIAIVVPRPGQTVEPEALREFLSTRLARFKIPREFLSQQTLPRTPTGKIMKHLLRAEL